MSTTPQKLSGFSVGQTVQFSFGSSQVQGEIVEDRGPIGAQGRRLFQVRIARDPYEAEVFEMPEDEIELVPEQEKTPPAPT